MKRNFVCVAVSASDPALAELCAGEGGIGQASGEVVAALRAAPAVAGRS